MGLIFAENELFLLQTRKHRDLWNEMYLQSCLKSILLPDFDIHGLLSVLKSIDIHVEIKTITLNMCKK